MAETGCLALHDRPAELKKIVKEPLSVNTWRHNGQAHNYRFGHLDGKNLVNYLGSTRARVNVLDVGCGAGAFLRECASDVPVTSKKFLFRGITGSDEVSHDVRRKLGDADPATLERAITDCLEKSTDCMDLKIYEHVHIEDLKHNSSVLDFVESATRFDLILCSWTALHVCDPFGLLVQLYDMLDVDGIVVTNMFFAAVSARQNAVFQDLFQRGYDVCVDLPDLAEEAADRGCRFEGIDIGIRKTESHAHLRLPLNYTDTIEVWGRVFGSGLQNDEPYSVLYSYCPVREPIDEQPRRGRISNCLASWAFGASEETQQKLLDAVSSCNLAAVRKAVAEGAVPNIAMPNGLFAVEAAVHACFGKGVKELLPITTALGAASKFCCAAAADEVPTLKTMLAESPDLLNDSTFSGMTPLMAASMCDGSDALCFLLHTGAQVNKMHKAHPRSPTALSLAVMLRKPVNLSVICILLGHGADWRQSMASPALHVACTAGRLDIVREIIAANIDRSTGLVKQLEWCGDFPMGLTIREVELLKSGGFFKQGGHTCFFPDYERKASEDIYIEIVKELYPVTADVAASTMRCMYEQRPAVDEEAPTLKQRAAAFLATYGICAHTLASSVMEGVCKAKFQYGDKVLIEGLKSATDLNGDLGFCCGTDPKSGRIRVSLMSGLKLVKPENLMKAGDLPVEDRDGILDSAGDFEGVNAQISDALMRTPPALSDAKVLLLTFSRDPAALGQTLLQAAELAHCREALEAGGLGVELPSGAKIFVRPEHHGPAVEAIRLYGLSLKPKHVVVDAELEQDVLEIVKALRPQKVYPKMRTIMPLALAELVGNCDYDVDISRTFIDIRVPSSLCSDHDHSHHAASTTQADPRKCKHHPKPKKRSQD